MIGKFTGTALATALLLVAAAPVEAPAQMRAPAVEYIDIRWDGVDKLVVVFPDAKVEFLGEALREIPRPDRVNGRAFYMTMAMGRMAARGYEFVGAFSDEIIMKKTLP